MASKAKSTLTRFQRFGLFFYDHVKTTFTLWVALVVFGFLSYSVFMQRQGFPNVEVPISTITGTYFVNDKIKVDKDVVKPVDDITLKQSNIKTLTSTAGDNFFAIVVEYKDGVKAQAGSDAIKKAVEADTTLPKNVLFTYKALNASKFNNEYDVLLAVHQGETTPFSELVTTADRLAKQLTATAGVASAKTISPFKAGTNLEGQPVTLQQTFDRVGLRENGKTVYYPSVQIGIVSKPGTDAIHLEKNLNAQIASLEAQPENKGAHVTVSAGVAENISTQIHNLQTNLLEGLVVVIIISLLLISWRAGIATALSMTTVLLITVGVLYAVGLTLNTITLFALVLCLGLIVDDTTIMAEAIDAGRDADMSNREIVATAIKRVARASTAGTLVTMLAFAPMLFISGILGSFIKVLPITIIVSLAVSLLVSLTIIPFMARRLLLKSKGHLAKEHNPISALEDHISNGLARMIRVGERSRKKASVIGVVAILISFAFLIGSGAFFAKLKFDIFPSTKDSNELGMVLNFPAGTTVQKAEAISRDADNIIANKLGSNFKSETYLGVADAQSATAQIELVDFKKREVKSPQLVDELNEAFAKEIARDTHPDPNDISHDKAVSMAGVQIKVSQLDVGPPKDDYPFRAQIYGEDNAKATRLANDVAKYLNGHEIKRANGTTAKIARVQVKGNDDTVERKQGKRILEVQAGFDADDVSALVGVAQKTVEDKFTASELAKYGATKSDVTFDFGNESNNQDSFKSMLYAFPVLLIIMYVLLAFQFGSLLQPLLIFTAIPFSFFGVAAGLHLTDNPLSFFVMIGFFALIGIAVNNTILLVDFANQERKTGKGGFESMALAVKARFRPLIATSLTSVLALIPLALSDPFWEGLAYTLIFGLLSSTLLVVVAFPYYYLAAEYVRSKVSRKAGVTWLIALIVIITALSKINPKAIPLGLLAYLLAIIATILKGFYARRLLRN